MPLNKDNLKAGDRFLMVYDKDDLMKYSWHSRLIQRGIYFFCWMVTKSPEIYHVGVIKNKWSGAEQNPPSSKEFFLSRLDDQFDKGLVYIVRPVKFSVSQEMKYQQSIDKHLNEPYGYLSVAYDAQLGILARLNLKNLMNYLKKKFCTVDLDHKRNCAQWVEMLDEEVGLVYSSDPNLEPGEFLTNKSFYVVQHKGL